MPLITPRVLLLSLLVAAPPAFALDDPFAPAKPKAPAPPAPPAPPPPPPKARPVAIKAPAAPPVEAPPAEAPAAEDASAMVAPEAEATPEAAPPTANAELIALREEVAALRAELTARLPAAPPPPPEAAPPAPDPRLVGLKAALEEARAAVGRLDEAVAGGLDPMLLAASYAAARGRVAAAEADLVLATAPPPPPKAPTTLRLELGLSSAYGWRGDNVFAQNSQSDDHALLAPGAIWTLGGTGLSLGYWGAFQWTGDNADQLIVEGVGHEQDLFALYHIEPAEAISVDGSLTAYLYPFADPDTVGTTSPTYLEPGVKLTAHGPLDLSLLLTYMAGLQEPLVEGRYLYANPRLSRSLALSDDKALALGAGAGFKRFSTDPEALRDNTVDITLDAALDYKKGAATFSPHVHAAWTNLATEPSGMGAFVWAGITAAVEP
jgi:hypothetical protein